MTSFFFKRRWNCFDLIAIGIGVDLMQGGHWVVALLLVVCLSIFSAEGERTLSENDRRYGNRA